MRLLDARRQEERVDAGACDPEIAVPDTYPAAMPEPDGRPATAEEFAAFEAEYGPFLPADGEG